MKSDLEYGLDAINDKLDVIQCSNYYILMMKVLYFSPTTQSTQDLTERVKMMRWMLESPQTP